MTMHEASRTLVKSTPELWAECSDGESLSRHLGVFGEIRITRLEPETAVAWEGDDVRGTVTLEPSGWGTRVVLTATAEAAGPAVAARPETAAGPDAAAEPTTAPEPEAAAEPETAAQLAPRTEPEPAPRTETETEPEPARPGFFARVFGFRRRSRPEAGPLGDEDPPIELAGGGESTATGSEPAPRPALAIKTRPEPAPQPQLPTRVEPEPAESRAPELEALVDALDSLGTPHRRPFSRA